MYIINDPFGSLFILTCLVVHLVRSSMKKKKPYKFDKEKHEQFMKWFAEEAMKRSPEYIRYQRWLQEHSNE